MQTMWQDFVSLSKATMRELLVPGGYDASLQLVSEGKGKTHTRNGSLATLEGRAKEVQEWLPRRLIGQQEGRCLNKICLNPVSSKFPFFILINHKIQKYTNN